MSRRTPLMLTAIWMALAAVNPACAAWDTGFSSIQVGRYKREYVLYQPSAAPAPLVIVLHGPFGALRGARKLGFEELALREGFSVVYPKGTNKQWMDGRHDEFARNNRSVDDIAFLKALIEKLVADKVADPDRVYIVGFSGGGIMAYRAACEMSGKLAGVAAVSASMPLGYDYICRPAEPVPLMMINGTSDAIIPWKGGEVSGNDKVDDGEVISINKNLEFWRRENKCSDTEHTDKLPAEKSLLPVLHHHWDNCEVHLYEIKGGQHAWPGVNSPLVSPTPFFAGNAAQLDATTLIWDFLKNKKRAAPSY